MNQRKCSECGEWIDAQIETCTNCNTVFYESEKEEHKINVERAQREMDIPMIAIHESDSPIAKFFKRIVQFHQVVFYLILYAISYMAAALAG
ncbi:MAG: hypothetical protein N4A46_11330 [Schleiferiaceae bacterium]|jgi:uncharacterized membrane protein YvbJ|nr:hypothetical protein [Schleiferiaceae bacterium]